MNKKYNKKNQKFNQNPCEIFKEQKTHKINNQKCFQEDNKWPGKWPTKKKNCKQLLSTKNKKIVSMQMSWLKNSELVKKII